MFMLKMASQQKKKIATILTLKNFYFKKLQVTCLPSISWSQIGIGPILMGRDPLAQVAPLIRGQSKSYFGIPTTTNGTKRATVRVALKLIIPHHFLSNSPLFSPNQTTNLLSYLMVSLFLKFSFHFLYIVLIIYLYYAHLFKFLFLKGTN